MTATGDGIEAVPNHKLEEIHIWRWHKKNISEYKYIFGSNA